MIKIKPTLFDAFLKGENYLTILKQMQSERNKVIAIVQQLNSQCFLMKTLCIFWFFL